MRIDISFLNPYNWNKEYIPLVSTLNSIAIIGKRALMDCGNLIISALNSYKIIHQKNSNLRQLILLVPVIGNVIVYRMDKKEQKNHQKRLVFAEQTAKNEEDSCNEQRGFDIQDKAKRDHKDQELLQKEQDAWKSYNPSEAKNYLKSYTEEEFLKEAGYSKKEILKQIQGDSKVLILKKKIKDALRLSDIAGFTPLKKELAKLKEDFGGNLMIFEALAEKGLLKDREVLAAGLTRDGLELKFLDLKIRDDKELVKIAVAQNGMALRFASPRLQRDQEIIKIAVNENPQAKRFAK